jgi:hypothetical protein
LFPSRNWRLYVAEVNPYEFEPSASQMELAEEIRRELSALEQKKAYLIELLEHYEG